MSGYVFDENNTPVPFANIYIKSKQTGTSTDIKGRYFYQFTNHGIYDVVVTAVGFHTQEFKIKVEDNKGIVKNIWLKTNIKELNEVVIKSKGRDPAYGIIKKAVDNKKRWKNQVKSSKVDVYIKAKEVITKKESKKRERKRKERERKKKLEEASKSKTDEEIFEEATKKKSREINKLSNSINMLEIKMNRHYQFPNKVKEIRTAYKKYGSTFGLYYKNTIQDEFVFYNNLMYLPKLNKAPLISPLNTISVLTYKFKLVKTTFKDSKMLFKIKVTPRKRGNATFNGFIWILDETFNLDKVDLTLHKGGLVKYTDFRVYQEYEFNKDSILLLTNQVFDYMEKSGKTRFTGKTTVNYSNYEINPVFPKKYFGNEVGITTQEAMDRDSSYWVKIRPKPLTVEEQRFQYVKDSIYEYLNSPAYLDSVDSVYNKITFMDVIWNGVGHRDRKNKQSWSFGSIPELISMEPVSGFRLGPGISYFKKWENEKNINVRAAISWGILNSDTKGSLSVSHKYDPMHEGYMSIRASRSFDILVTSDAVSNLFERANWIEADRLNFRTHRELFNGFFGYFEFNFEDRKSINNYKHTKIFDALFDKPNIAINFAGYQSTSLGFAVWYTPFQKYMLEPKRKVILGSKWPTFNLYYLKGVNGLLGSKIDFDYIRFNINQNFKVRTLGTSSYRFSAGKFLSKRNLKREDYKIFPRSDKWFFASFLQSMQLQDTTINVTDHYFQLNYIHHFNGAVINFVPLIKKLGIHTVIGTSGLLIPTSNYRYAEVFAGVERTFKISRTRFRLGVYFVEAKSNYNNIKPRIKFGINFYSFRNDDWGF